MRKKLLKAVVASAAVCLASGMIITSGGFGTAKAADGDVVLKHDFEDDKTDGFMANGVTLSIADKTGVNEDGSAASGKCLKISGRDKGTDWWERNGLCYDLKQLTPGLTYKISFDFSHEGEEAEGSPNRAFKVNTYYTEGYNDSTAEYKALKDEAKTEYENTHTAMYGQVGSVKGTSNGAWEHIEGTITPKEDAVKSTGKYIAAVFMGYIEAAKDGSYKIKNTEDYYIDNFSITEYVEPTKEPTAAPTTAVAATDAPTVSVAPAQTAAPVETPVVVEEDFLENGYEEAVKGITYVVTGRDTVKVKEFDTSSSKLTIPATITLDEDVYKVTEIGNNAFKGESDVKTLVIGTNVTKIGKSAFYKCTSLKKITISSKSIKSIGKNAFKKTNAKAVVKVPKAKKAAYKKLLKKAGLSAKATVK